MKKACQGNVRGAVWSCQIPYPGNCWLKCPRQLSALKHIFTGLYRTRCGIKVLGSKTDDQADWIQQPAETPQLRLINSNNGVKTDRCFPAIASGLLPKCTEFPLSPQRALKAPPEIDSKMSFPNTKAGARPAWQEAPVPGAQKKRFASCRRIATAVPLDLPV